MPAYESEGLFPPAAFARAVVRSASGAALSDVPLLVDTGADVSAVPRAVITRVGAAVQSSSVRLRSFDGSEANCDVADLTVECSRYRFQGAFVVADAEYGILGRNILNALLVTLDGPRAIWSA